MSRILTISFVRISPYERRTRIQLEGNLRFELCSHNFTFSPTTTQAMRVTCAFTAPINPPSASPKLTRAQVWTGLVAKARNPTKYVPDVVECEVLEEHADGLTRMIKFAPPGAASALGKVKEVVTFTKEVRVCGI